MNFIKCSAATNRIVPALYQGVPSWCCQHCCSSTFYVLLLQPENQPSLVQVFFLSQLYFYEESPELTCLFMPMRLCKAKPVDCTSQCEAGSHIAGSSVTSRRALSVLNWVSCAVDRTEMVSFSPSLMTSCSFHSGVLDQKRTSTQKLDWRHMISNNSNSEFILVWALLLLT